MATMADDESTDAGTPEMATFCQAVGELILWANMIDGQLNKAVIAALALSQHAMIEPVVAQLDARPKAELLKKRAKFITNVSWRNGIKNWVERTEKVNSNRNYVAHHQIRIRNGKIAFHSDQLGKVFDKLTMTGGVIEPQVDKGVADVLDWIEHSKKVYEEGTMVLENLERFRAEAAQALAAEAASK
jgi:hypothetical protein